MQPTISLSIALPILLQLLQVGLLLMLSIAVLRKRKLIADPVGGADYSTVIYTAAILLGVLLLASGSTGYLFRTYKAVSNGDAIFKEVTLAFSKFLIVTLCAIAVYLGLCFAAAEILGKGKGRQELSTGNIPLAVLCAAVCIGLSIVLLGMTKPVYEWMTPVYLNFR